MEPIAIVGLGCLFPGAQTTDEFWQNLLAGRDSISAATAEQMGVDAERFFDAANRRVDIVIIEPPPASSSSAHP